MAFVNLKFGLRPIQNDHIPIPDGIQLNSTQLTTPKEEWINQRKEAKKLIYIPDSLVNSQYVS